MDGNGNGNGTNIESSLAQFTWAETLSSARCSYYIGTRANMCVSCVGESLLGYFQQTAA